MITDARGSLIRNYDHRKHTYAILQWSRIPLLLLSGVFYMWWHLPWLAAIFMIVSIPMPWIAVVIANGVGEPADKRQPRVYKPAVVREQNRRWEEQQRKQSLVAQTPLALGYIDSDSPTNNPTPPPPNDGSDAGFSAESFPRDGRTIQPSDCEVIDMPEDLPGPGSEATD